MKNSLIVGLLVVALALGFYASFLKDGGSVGVVSPFNPTPNINLGGLNLTGTEKALAQGTSTVCAIQSPTATSTLISGGVKFSLATTAVAMVDISKATTQYATSTAIGTAYSISGSAKATIVASTTGSAAGEATIFAPNTWFIAKYGSWTDGTGNVSTGRCWALFAKPL